MLYKKKTANFTVFAVFFFIDYPVRLRLPPLRPEGEFANFAEWKILLFERSTCEAGEVWQ
jgi:hypothetical protein